MDAMHEICEKFKDELDEFARQDKFTVEDIKIIDAITHTIKSIQTVKAMDAHGYSYRSYSPIYHREGEEWEGESRAMRGSHRDGYTYRDGRSRDDSRDMLRKHAEKIMTHTDSPEVRRAAEMLIMEIDRA